MTTAVTTPLSQALAGTEISRREIKAFMKRKNTPALGRLTAWLVMLALTSALIAVSMDTIWVWPAMLVQGIVIVHHFSLQHECTHYTAFRSRWLNDVVGALCGVSIGLAPRFFRYEHCDHHTFTQLAGRDPEMLTVPNSFWGYFGYISSGPYWWAKLRELTRHSLGTMADDEARFVPKEEYANVFLEARVLVVIYAATGAVMIMFQWWAPLWYWLIPLLLGEPVMRFIRMTEHVGCPQVSDLKTNTRTNLVGPLWRFLSWNMNYHAEHHFASSVPFHALPALHNRLQGHLHVERKGYLGAHREIAQLVSERTRASAA
jgi:fatty acid desaturase